MATSRTPLLGRAILGLLNARPMSGYQLRKVFAATPLGLFSDSPGSIYPALRRLEDQQLVTGRTEKPRSLRPSRVFRPTAAGVEVLRQWLDAPVTTEDAARRGDELILRFAFMEPVLGRRRVRRFLHEWEEGLDAHLAALDKYRATAAKQLPLTGRLALESGVEGYRAQLGWMRRARSLLGRSRGKETA